MSSGQSREWAEFHDKLRKELGFVLVSCNNHMKFRTPDGRLFVCPKTGSERRGILNARAQVRRMGYKL